jgi:hypothetical protein
VKNDKDDSRSKVAAKPDEESPQAVSEEEGGER